MSLTAVSTSWSRPPSFSFTYTAQVQWGAELRPYADHPAVRDVRVLGGIGVVETREPVPVARAQRGFVEDGVWIRPFGRLIYLMPPYVIESADLARLTRAIGPALEL